MEEVELSDEWLNAVVEVRERKPRGARAEAVRTAIVDVRSADSLGLPFSPAAVEFEAEGSVWLRGRVELAAVAWCLSHDWWGYAVSLAKARKWAARPELWCGGCGAPEGVVSGWFLGDVGDVVGREAPPWSFVDGLPGDDAEGRAELLELIGTSRYAMLSSVGADGRRRSAAVTGLQFRPSLDQVRAMVRLMRARVETAGLEVGAGRDATGTMALEVSPHELGRFGGPARARAAARAAAKQLGLRVATFESKEVDGRGVYVVMSALADGVRLAAVGTAELARTGRLLEDAAAKYYRLKYAHVTERFQADRPAVVYLVTSASLRAHKVGIMKAGTSRLEDHRSWGWRVVNTLECATGEVARAVESRVLRHLRDVRKLGVAVSAAMMPQGGFTETVDARAISAAEVWDQVLEAAQGVVRREALVRGQTEMRVGQVGTWPVEAGAIERLRGLALDGAPTVPASGVWSTLLSFRVVAGFGGPGAAREAAGQVAAELGWVYRTAVCGLLDDQLIVVWGARVNGAVVDAELAVRLRRWEC